MEELQVPTRSVPVEVFDVDGRRLPGFFYLVESEYNTDQRGGILKLLNDERMFLPFQSGAADGEGPRAIMLLNKEHISRVRMGEICAGVEDAVEEASLETGPRAILSFADGSRVAGEVMVDTPWSSSRLVDKMNHLQRFIQVRCDHGHYAIQRSQIVQVTSSR